MVVVVVVVVSGSHSGKDAVLEVEEVAVLV